VLETVGTNTLFLLLAGVFIVGACVGSFINVVAYRLPIMALDATEDSHFNLAWPGSHCPHCQFPIRYSHNIPVLSYLLLNGRSACCQQRIPFGYIVRELLGGLLALAVVLTLNLSSFAVPGIAPTAWSLILVWWLLAIVSLIGRHPDAMGKLSQTLLWLGLIANVQAPFSSLEQSVFAVCCCYGLGWLGVIVFAQAQQAWGGQILCVAHLVAAGLAWFGFSFLATSTAVMAALSVGAFAVFQAAGPGSRKVRLGLWPAWLQGSLVILIVYQWLVWIQDF
jgi:prepilin signal peptidase PulO-like enzyme (type II secretory pathway)